MTLPLQILSQEIPQFPENTIFNLKCMNIKKVTNIKSTKISLAFSLVFQFKSFYLAVFFTIFCFSSISGILENDDF